MKCRTARLSCSARRLNLRALVLLLFFALVIVPQALATSPANITADAGNVTEVNFSIVRLTDHWQGFFGQVIIGENFPEPAGVNATGSLVNETRIVIQVPCKNPASARGVIMFSNSSEQPTNLVAGNLTILDELTGFGSDSGSGTFTGTSTFTISGSGTITGVPTTFTFVNKTPQFTSFRQGYFNQNANLVFATVVEQDLLGFNESLIDYQMMVLAPNRTTVPYFVFSDITFDCPGEGGGFRPYPRKCVVFWDCTVWSSCSPEGFQYRNCTERNWCPGRYPRPAQTRVCVPPIIEEPALISEFDIVTEELMKNVSLVLEPGTSEILVPARMRGLFENRNPVSIEDVHFTITTPDVLTAARPAHPFPKWLWNKLFGWADHGVPEPKQFSWRIAGLPEFKTVNPKSAVPVSFEIVPPLMFPSTVAVGAHAFSGPSRVASASAPFIVEIPEFGVYASTNSRNVLTLYFVVDNRDNKAQSINIELSLNKGRNALVAELLGPLKLPAGKIMIFGHEYALSKKALSANVLDARLVTKQKVLRARRMLR